MYLTQAKVQTKIKPKKSAVKRFKVTSTGKLMHSRSGKQHLAVKKSGEPSGRWQFICCRFSRMMAMQLPVLRLPPRAAASLPPPTAPLHLHLPPRANKPAGHHIGTLSRQALVRCIPSPPLHSAPRLPPTQRRRRNRHQAPACPALKTQQSRRFVFRYFWCSLHVSIAGYCWARSMEW